MFTDRLASNSLLLANELDDIFVGLFSLLDIDGGMIFGFHPAMRLVAVHSILAACLLDAFDVVRTEIPVRAFFSLD